MSRPYQNVKFEKVALCFITEQLEMCESKIDVLRLFNCQLVAAIKIDKAQFKSLKTYDDIRVTELDFRDEKMLPLEIKFYGIVRDIDYQQGIMIIPEYNIDVKD